MPGSGLDGSVALVNGAAGAGIGGAVADRLAAAGARLILTDISERRLERLRERLPVDDRDHLLVAMDAGDEAAVAELVRRVDEQYGRVDVLVNSVGINRGAGIADMDLATWTAVLRTSLTSHFLHIRGVWSLMLAQGGGAIVNIASVAAWSPSALGEAHYAAAKAGVLGLTRAAAAEGAKVGIRVNAVAPGLIYNEHLSKAAPEAYQLEYLAMGLSGRAGTPAEVADVVHFLASDASRHVTGETVTVAGGHLARH